MSLPFDPILAAAFHRLNRVECLSVYDDVAMATLRRQYSADTLHRHHQQPTDLFTPRLALHSERDTTCNPVGAKWKTHQHHHYHHPHHHQQQQPDPGPMMAGDTAIVDSLGECSVNDNDCVIRTELEGRELWKKFDSHCSEMVITKSGR